MSIYLWCTRCQSRENKCKDLLPHKAERNNQGEPIFQYRTDFMLGGRRGTRIREVKATKKEALDFERTTITRYKDGVLHPRNKDGKVLFKEFADRYYNEHCLKENRHPERSTKYRVEQAKHYLGNRFLSEVTRTELRQLQSQLRSSDWEASTVNRFFVVLKAIFNKACEWEVLDKNPADYISKLNEKEPIPRFLTLKEINQLRGAIKEQHVQDYVTALLHTGMRPGALKELAWDQVDMENRYLHLVTYKGRKIHRYSLWVDDQLYELLLRRASVTRKMGRVLDTHNIRKLVETAIIESAINENKPKDQRFTIYGLKHSFASHHLMQGTSPDTVRHLLGHTTTRMVEKHYGHLTKEYLKTAQSKVNLTPEISPSLPACVRGVTKGGDSL